MKYFITVTCMNDTLNAHRKIASIPFCTACQYPNGSYSEFSSEFVYRPLPYLPDHQAFEGCHIQAVF